MDFKEKVSYPCNSAVDHFLQSNTSILQMGILLWFVTKVVVLVDDLVMKLETMSAQTEIFEEFNFEENWKKTAI